jgi:hypothetical protein
MTTIAQVKLAARPLLERNSDLALVGRLVVKPVRHILRGIYLDRSLDPGTLTPTWFVNILFEHGAHVTFVWGGRLYNRAHGPWGVGIAATPTVMCEEIERHALPSSANLNSYLSKLMADFARGDFDSAQAICTKFATGCTIWSAPDMREDLDRATREICPKIASNDRPGLAHLLHAWEADLVKRLKLETFWEPTPFPLELQPA